MGDLGQVLWLHLQRGVPVHKGYGDVLPFGSSPRILGRDHGDPELRVLPAPPGAACSSSVSLASFGSRRKENLDVVAQGRQGQGGEQRPSAGFFGTSDSLEGPGVEGSLPGKGAT